MKVMNGVSKAADKTYLRDISSIISGIRKRMAPLDGQIGDARR